MVNSRAGKSWIASHFPKRLDSDCLYSFENKLISAHILGKATLRALLSWEAIN